MKYFFKKGISLLLAVFALIVPLCLTANASESFEMPDLSHSKNVYLYNITADTLMFSKGADEIIYPGPTVKLMTAAVAIDCLGGNLNRIITIREDVIDEVRGNNINLRPDEKVTVLQLLNALIVGNSNDAAIVLAVEAAGSVGAFVIKMNELAQKLGASNTFYTNPTGMHDDDMVTTISDTAKIAMYLNRYDIFTEIAQKEFYILEKTNKSRERKIFNRNYFINTQTEYIYYSPYVKGMNAGATEEAGYCVVASSEYRNSEYLCIVMGSESDDNYIYSFRDAGLMLTWAYRSYAYRTVLKSSDIICSVPVRLSSQTDTIAIMPSVGIELYLPNEAVVGKDVTISWLLDIDELTAPIEENTVVGKVTLLYENKVVGQTDLVTKTAVARSDYLYIMSLAERFFKSPAFIVIAVLIVISTIGYIAFSVVTNTRRQRQIKARQEMSEKKIIK